MNERNNIQTPEETAQAVSDLAERLAEMDKAEGVFGEAISDEELESAAGGQPFITKQPLYCQYCHTFGPHECKYGYYPR